MEYADTPFELKSLSNAGAIEGVAAGIGNVDRGGDRILPGAFTKTLAARAGRPLPMLRSHDLNRPIGVWTDFNETNTGLFVKGRLTMTTRDAQEAYALARDGALQGLSIGWLGKGVRTNDGVRELAEIELFEASLVTVPMNDAGRVTAIKSITNAKDIADLLREGGLSSRRSRAAAHAAWKAINDTDDEEEAEAHAKAILDAAAARIRAMGA